MKKTKTSLLLAVLFFASFVFSGCGNNNIFGWAHSAGSDSNAQSLSSDAYAALQNKDYAKAMEYYQKILDSDSNNSEAIYGYSAAKLGDAGLSIGDLVSNMIKQTASAPKRLSPAVAYMANSKAQSSAMLPSTIDEAKVLKALDVVLGDSKLKRIIKGLADGTISPDDPDLNINVAFCLVLRAALKAKELGAAFNDDYSCDTGSLIDNDDFRKVLQDLASAYKRFLVVIGKVNLGSDSSIANIRADVKTLFETIANTVKNVDLDADYL